MVKLRKHQFPEMFALKKFAKNKQNFSFLFHEICILYTIFSRLGNPFVLRYIPRVPIMSHCRTHQFWLWPGKPLPLVEYYIHASWRAQSQTGSLRWSPGLWRSLTWLTPEKDDKDKHKDKHKDSLRWRIVFQYYVAHFLDSVKVVKSCQIPHHLCFFQKKLDNGA